MGYFGGCLGSVDNSPTTAWVNAVIANGGTVSASRRNLVDNLLTGLQADGIYQKLDSLRVYAAENQVSALTNMVPAIVTGSGLAVVFGSPTFSTDRGYTGIDQSASDFIDSKWDPATNGKNYQINSAHFSVWCTTDNASTVNGGCMFGAADNGGNVIIGLYNTFGGDGNIYGRINDNVAGGAQGIPTTRKGHWVVNRDSSTTSQIYQNATLFSSPNQAAFTAYPNALDLYALACDETGSSAFSGSPNQIAAATIGASLSSSDVQKLYNRLRSYMTAVGIP